MNLVFVTEGRFKRDLNGIVYAENSSFSLELWNRYLMYFDKIYIIARVQNISETIKENEFIASSEKVVFLDVYYYHGLLDLLKRIRIVQSLIRENLPVSECVYILRGPGVLSYLVAKELIKRKINYGVEVVGDPWDVFAPGAFNSIFRPILRYAGYYSLKELILHAKGVLYVTKEKLQKRYPAQAHAFTTYASNVKIERSYFADSPKKWSAKKSWKIISIGSLEQMYKSPDIVISALKYINASGINCDLIWLGDGKFLDDLEKKAIELGIEKSVKFVGNVSANQVRSYLYSSDLFVLASRTEGLPRAMIEAMAVGLPIVGTNVGGIPELLETKVLVPPNDDKALANKMREIIADHVLYDLQASRNFQESKNYAESVLSKRREQFYQFLIENT